MSAFDILGNVAIVNFREGVSVRNKREFAEKILKENKAVKTILEKVGKVSGRLRKPKTRFLAGEKTKEVLYRENGCVFRFDVDETYFSPRLSNERKEIASKIKKGEDVLVMFAGVGPFPIVIAKNSKANKVYSNEINRKANKYAELNIELNKLKKKVFLVQGDAKKIGEKIGSQVRVMNNSLITKNFGDNKFKISRAKRVIPKFDVIVMPRPQLKDSFLKEAFKLSKKGTRIYYYDFCKVEDKNLIVEKIQEEAKKQRRKIRILKVKDAGEIAPYKVRVRVDFVVL